VVGEGHDSISNGNGIDSGSSACTEL